MGCFEPFAVKLKAFAQKLKASLKKKPQQSARTATPLREQAVAEATAVVESGEVASIQVPTAAEVVTATVEAVDTETKVPFESSLSQLATTAIAHEVAIGQRLAAAKYGVALEAIEPKQVSKQDSAISLKSGMYDAKPIYSNTLEFPESVGQMYQVKPFYEAKEEEESVNEPGWLNLVKKAGKNAEISAPFLPFDLAGISNCDVKAAEVRAALARSSYKLNSN